MRPAQADREAPALPGAQLALRLRQRRVFVKAAVPAEGDAAAAGRRPSSTRASASIANRKRRPPGPACGRLATTPVTTRSRPSSSGRKASRRRIEACQPVRAKPASSGRDHGQRGAAPERAPADPGHDKRASAAPAQRRHRPPAAAARARCSWLATPASHASASAAIRPPLPGARIAAKCRCRGVRFAPSPRRASHHVLDLRSPDRPRHLPAAACHSRRRLRSVRAQRQSRLPFRPHRQARRQALGRPARARHDHRDRQEGGARRRDRPARHPARRGRRPRQGRAHRADHQPRQQRLRFHRASPRHQRLLGAVSARSSPRKARMRAAPTAWRSCRWAPASRSS